MELIGKVAVVSFGTGQDYAGKVIAPRDIVDGLAKIKVKLGSATFLISEGAWLNKAIDRVQEEEGRTVSFTYSDESDLLDKCSFIRDTLRQSKVAVIVDGHLFEH